MLILHLSGEKVTFLDTFYISLGMTKASSKWQQVALEYAVVFFVLFLFLIIRRSVKIVKVSINNHIVRLIHKHHIINEA